MDERVRWLSSVCEVITEPSDVAIFPQVMEVQPSGTLSIQSVLSTCAVTCAVQITNIA
jgi:hypothetical protein